MTIDELLAKYHEIAEKMDSLTQRAARAEHERDEYKKLYELLSLELERTRRHLFGKKAETADPAQTQLAFTQATAAIGTAPGPSLDARGDGHRRGGTGEKSRTPHGRKKPPEHLLIERIELNPPEWERSPESYEASAKKCASSSSGVRFARARNDRKAQVSLEV